MNYYKRALELKEETIANRRYLHEHAETGSHLEKYGGVCDEAAYGIWS